MMFHSDAVHTLNAPQPQDGMADRRPTSRRRALLGGVVVHSGGRFTVPCTIRNLSEGGARIAFKRGQMLPSEFFLVDTWAGQGHRARVIWMTASEAGISFSERFDMNAITDPALNYLKRFWAQRIV